jgi:Uma2 family endonuclease
MDSITLTLGPIIDLTDEQFLALCQTHRDYRFERTASGDLIIMPPTGGETGHRNSELTFQLQAWSRQNEELGIAFDSSAGFKLPNGANRSPDASWVRRDRWASLTSAQRQGFPPLCPDFVVELRSLSDPLSLLQAKMQEYLENGAQLGWLIDPQRQQVEIYRPDQTVEIIESPNTLSGEEVLPGFVLELARIL